MIITDLQFLEKIKKINNKNIQDEKKIVVGLSGGADSLCLTLLMDFYTKQNNYELYACIIDHKLRIESSTEIIPIIDILDKRNIKYKVIKWENHPQNIKGNLEQKAREARYRLLYNFCKDIDSKILMTAHHSLDQWETFFMRLSRGSAVRGLSCIKKESKFKDIYLIRPFLDYSPNDIKETLEKRFMIHNYVKDPMNKQEKYERVFWRNSYKDLSKKYNLNTDNINKSIHRIQRVNSFIEELSINYASDILIDNTYINLKKFKDLNIEIKIRVLDIIIKKINNKNMIISDSLLERISYEIVKQDFKAINLAGLILKKDKTKNIKILKENRNI